MRRTRLVALVALALAAAVVAMLLAPRTREGYDPKKFVKHGQWYCPEGYTWGTGDQQGKCCREGGDCVGAVQKSTTLDEAKTIVKNWCLAGSSVADVERKNEGVAIWARGGQRRTLNRVCNENRAKWAASAKAAGSVDYGARDWKLCPNKILRVTRPRKVAHMCCRANKTGCMDARMFETTAAIGRLKRRGCSGAKPTCENAARPVCDRPARGMPYTWTCPERTSAGTTGDDDRYPAFSYACPRGEYVTWIKAWERDDDLAGMMFGCSGSGGSDMVGTKSKSGSGDLSNKTMSNGSGFGYINVSANEHNVRGLGAETQGGAWVEHGGMANSRRLECPSGKKIVGFSGTTTGGMNARTEIRRLRIRCG